MSQTDTAPEMIRQHIGPIDGDPVTTHPNLEALTPLQRALRLAVIKEFKAKKAKKFVEKQIKQINSNIQLAEGIGFLFDESGQPPPNAPMEDIIEERRRLEYEIKWFEAVVAELQARLVKVREIEDHALDLLGQRADAEMERGFR